MGLTGVILHAVLRLKRVETAYIRQEILPARDLHHIMELFEASQGWTYSVAWIDCVASGSKLRVASKNHSSAGPVTLR